MFKDSLEGYFKKCWEIIHGRRRAYFTDEPFCISVPAIS